MIHIITHCLPQEIDQLEQLLIQLKRSSIHVDKDDFMVEVVLNLNLTYWDSSDTKLDQYFFIDKFSRLEKLTKSWCKTNFEINDDRTILGCNDLRRRALRTSESDYIMYLDCDNIFSDQLLYYMLYASNKLKNEPGYHIITPEVTRMWDNTWDVITNRNYLNIEASRVNYFDRDPYDAIGYQGSVTCNPIETFKFAGWGTCIQTKIREIIDIPDSLGPYGLDDTFIMEACKILKSQGVEVYQYVLENQIIIENNKFRHNPYQNYLHTIDNREEYLKQANINAPKELIKYLVESK
jgi:hypothetical protein